ncbi:MAG: pyruvate kinase [Chlamydiales bacterium]
MHTRTKIICTIGPSVDTVDKVIELMQAGMNAARLNFSHGTHEEHAARIQRLKEARESLGLPLAIMLDTKGPEMRTGRISEREIHLSPGHRWLLTTEEVEGDLSRITIKPHTVIEKLKIGTRVLFDDGYISSHVVDIIPEGVIVEIENGGTIKSGRGINVPDTDLGLPALTDKDIEDIRFGCSQDIDLIAASFIRSPEHVIAIKDLLASEGKSEVLVISKIESAEGVRNFDQILQVSDGIMIARGDLGVELPLSQVPRLQKMMIQKCCESGKPAVTATQMLESMIRNVRPTRAETSDVANAIYDSTALVMLSGETAVGEYPVETVKVMRSIIEETENAFDYQGFLHQYASKAYHEVPVAVTFATVKTAYSTDAKAIFVFTSSGATARLLARFRPQIPIIAMTHDIKCYHQLAFVWGVIPLYYNQAKTIEEVCAKITEYALENKFIDNGDLVIIATGSPFGYAGTTNAMIVESIGKVLVRGQSGIGEKCHANVTIVYNPESRKSYELRGKFLVTNRFNKDFIPLANEAKGIILDNASDDRESAQQLLEFAKNGKKTAIIHADAAMRILKEGGLVTIDPAKAIIYKGIEV